MILLRSVRNDSRKRSRLRGRSRYVPLRGEFLEDRLAPAVFMVTNTDDTGVGSLRQAILDANADVLADSIRFEIPGTGPHTISVLTQLPSISSPVEIDGWSQPGYSGTPTIELSGASVTGVAHGLTITGRDSLVRGLAINRFPGSGILLNGGATGNRIQGNFIGTDVTGNAALGNVSAGLFDAGVRITGGASANIIGTDGDGVGDPVEGNLISGNNRDGILINTATSVNNVVAGNRIGTNAAGTTAVANTNHGVLVFDTSGTRVGTNGDGLSDQDERNLISGNGVNGIRLLTNVTSSLVAGNYIGTDVTGNTEIHNGANGVEIIGGASHNTIGGSTAAAGNVISGNLGSGVRIADVSTNGNVVSGNYIGTAASGSAALGNRGHGVAVDNSAANVIGGTTAGAGNVISGNTGNGVDIRNVNAIGNRLQGNLIGIDVTGTRPLGNAASGVQFSLGTSNNRIGGGEGALNVISANLGFAGIFMVATSDNVVEGNHIGVDVTGTLALGNSGRGVEIKGGSQRNRIGTDGDGQDDASERNIISGNGGTGIMIWEAGTSANSVAGNYIGTDVLGSTALANHVGVSIFRGAAGNMIGGAAEAALNLISGNKGPGIQVFDPGTSGNVIAGNYIGADASGRNALGNDSGVLIYLGASDNTVGGSTAAAGNLISGNNGHGVQLFDPGTDRNRVSGNLIGTNVSGTAALGNTFLGVQINAGPSFNIIGGSFSGSGNVISGNGTHGVLLSGNSTTNNTIAGNFIGTDLSGMSALGNGIDGVTALGGASNNRIADNLISANVREGIRIADPGTNGNIVTGNLVGTKLTGTAALGNRRHGIVITNGAQGNRVGTDGDGIDDDAERNLSSGNQNFGILVTGTGTNGNIVAGNYLGTDATGMQAVPNLNHGIVIAGGAASNRIGTDGSNDPYNANERNVVSGNAFYGISLDVGATQNVVAGNYVGLKATGSGVLTNGWQGVSIDRGSTLNRIGTNGDAIVDALERNIICGSGADGIVIARASNGNIVAGNNIGVDASGKVPCPNALVGVAIQTGAYNNRIGTNGDGANDAEEANLIAYNLGAGVSVVDSDTAGNSIRGNSIFSNGGLGIDLGNDGVTPNDLGDSDSGPNGLLGFPILTVAQPGEAIRAIGSYQGQANTTLTLDFYASTAADASGYGEGERHLGFATVTTDAAGSAAFDVTLTATGTVGEVLTATATDAAGSTSEFSPAVTIVSTGLQGDPLNPGGQLLAVSGTSGNDVITVNNGSGAGNVQVIVNNIVVASFPATIGRIVIYGLEGADTMQVVGGISVSVWMYGGPDNDVLLGGAGNDVLLGGAGDDVLTGGQGRDILVGGTGADVLIAGANDDLLIAGLTSFDNNDLALSAIWNEWNSSRSYTTRAANLSGSGSGPRLNGEYFLKTAESEQTVFDDGDADTLTGSSGLDWFFANVSLGTLDLLLDVNSGELLEDPS